MELSRCRERGIWYLRNAEYDEHCMKREREVGGTYVCVRQWVLVYALVYAYLKRKSG